MDPDEVVEKTGLKEVVGDLAEEIAGGPDTADAVGGEVVEGHQKSFGLPDNMLPPPALPECDQSEKTSQESNGETEVESNVNVEQAPIEEFQTALLLVVGKDGKLLFVLEPPMSVERKMDFEEAYGVICRAKMTLETKFSSAAVSCIVQQGLMDVPRIMVEAMQNPKKAAKNGEAKKPGLWTPDKQQ